MAAIWALFLLTFLSLSGCTKGERDTAPPAATESVPPRALPKTAADERPAIVALGDSLSEGFGVEPGQSFPDQLQRKLDSTGYSYRVVNLGVSGDTSTGGLGRAGYAVSLHPAVVILELGGNDGLRGIPVAATKQNLESIIIQLKRAGSAVLLAGMTLPPNYGEAYIRSFEQAYKDLAERHSLPLIPFLMEDIRSRLASTPDLMQRDGIHPTAKGHALIAETVFRYLKPLLRREPKRV
jgi:acyl-CoA thioesterase I